MKIKTMREIREYLKNLEEEAKRADEALTEAKIRNEYLVKEKFCIKDERLEQACFNFGYAAAQLEEAEKLLKGGIFLENTGLSGKTLKGGEKNEKILD